MFAVVKTGGKQYKVQKNDVLKLEKISGTEGEIILLEDVLAVGDEKGITLGNPRVEKVKVAAEVLEQKKDTKVIIFKKRRRQNSRRKNGHRQQVTVVRIQDIGENVKAKAAPAKKAEATPAAKPAAKAAAKPAEKKTEAKPAAKPAAKKAPAKKADTEKKGE
jgi:large subunit ribosomal protein L21